LRDNSQALPRENGLFSDKTHHYRAYGLLISSELTIAHFQETRASEDPDVCIRYGEIFGRGYKPPATIQIEASPSRLLLRGAKSATILITGGDTITVEPLPNGNLATTMQILLGWALGGLFHQRAMLPLHGSALCQGDDCFVFCAPSGAGKSTLAAAFLNRDFKFLDDNIAVVDFDYKSVYIAAGSPELRLWESAIPALEFEYETVGRIRPDRDKFSLIVRQKFRSEKARLRKIFILKRRDISAVSFLTLTGAAKFQSLLEHVFGIKVTQHHENRAGLFRLVHALAQRVPVVEIRLPHRQPTPDALSDIILGAGVMH
jgi:hypothetical protein